MAIPKTVSPEGLRARAELVRGRLDDGGSLVRHLELAAAKIERLQAALEKAERYLRAGDDTQIHIADELMIDLQTQTD